MIWTSGLAADFWREGRSEACPVIDMHGHMGPWRAIYLPRAATDLMIRSMDASGVRMLVFCHHAALLCPDIGNAANVEAVRRFPDRLRAYLAINPNYPEAMARDLADYDKYSDVYVGLKLLAGYHGVAWDHAAYESAWRFAEERGLVVLGHTWGGSSLDGPEQVRKAAARYRNVRLLCGHSMHGAWDEAVAIARDLPNVYLELTAVLDTDRGAVEKFCRAGLSERVVFGTDLPWFDQHQGIGAILSAEITDEDRHNMLHRNAERLLRGLAGLAF
ncbi:MAG TPA: amidohydrolase family protein [Phycisphaerae bacterium]|nr:amidohydrolase family protein [Phycisphaerae bacterium]